MHVKYPLSQGQWANLGLKNTFFFGNSRQFKFLKMVRVWSCTFLSILVAQCYVKSDLEKNILIPGIIVGGLPLDVCVHNFFSLAFLRLQDISNRNFFLHPTLYGPINPLLFICFQQQYGPLAKQRAVEFYIYYAAMLWARLPSTYLRYTRWSEMKAAQ